jgi:hypothetical protein
MWGKCQAWAEPDIGEVDRQAWALTGGEGT